MVGGTGLLFPIRRLSPGFLTTPRPSGIVCGRFTKQRNPITQGEYAVAASLFDRYHDALATNQTVVQVGREEYLDYLTFKTNRRPMFIEIFGPLVGLKDEWAAQGASPQECDLSAFTYRHALSGSVPVNTGWLGGEEKILEETEDYVTALDRMGRHVRLAKKAATVPLPMDHPVKDTADWLKIKHHYEFSEERFAPNWEDTVHRMRAEDKVITVEIPGGYDEPRQLLGEENLSYAYFEQPELIRDILDTIGATAAQVLERVSSRVQVDLLHVHEDLAGSSGPMVGPRQVLEFIKPYYRRIWDLLKKRGVRLFSQDSDGDIRPVIPAFIESGLNLLYPMEPAAHMDIVKTRAQYGTQLAFMGGIDKFALGKDRAAIVRELEYKIPPLVRTGGCILGLDHRIPNGTPLENYRFYISQAWRILDREAAKL